MFISLINRQTRKPNDVNTDHIVSIWSEDDITGVWEVTRCRDVNCTLNMKCLHQKTYFYKKLA